MLAASLGDCPETTNCISENGRAVMFYGVPTVFFSGGLLISWLFKRHNDR